MIGEPAIMLHGKILLIREGGLEAIRASDFDTIEQLQRLVEIQDRPAGRLTRKAFYKYEALIQKPVK